MRGSRNGRDSDAGAQGFPSQNPFCTGSARLAILETFVEAGDRSRVLVSGPDGVRRQVLWLCAENWSAWRCGKHLECGVGNAERRRRYRARHPDRVRAQARQNARSEASKAARKRYRARISEEIRRIRSGS